MCKRERGGGALLNVDSGGGVGKWVRTKMADKGNYNCGDVSEMGG